MATITICDSCGDKGVFFLKVRTVVIHPRGGKEMPTLHDVCFNCAAKMDLRIPHAQLPRFKKEEKEEEDYLP